MQEMLNSLGFKKLTDTKYIAGETMMILVRYAHIYCTGDVNNTTSVECAIERSDLETMKHQVKKFMDMVGKCIQVDEE